MVNIDSTDYAYAEVEKLIVQAKDAGHEFKKACDEAIQGVMTDLTQAIKDTEVLPFPGSGFFQRHKAKFSRYRKRCRLHKELRFFEDLKVQAERSLVDSYQDAQRIADKIQHDIHHPYQLDKDLAGPIRSLEELVAGILAAKREFRKKILQAVHEMDLRLDELRDRVADPSTKASVTRLMGQVCYEDGLKLSQLENLNRRGSLLVAAESPAVEAMASVEAATVNQVPEEAVAEEDEESYTFPQEVQAPVEEPIAAPVEEMAHEETEEPVPEEEPMVNHVPEEAVAEEEVEAYTLPPEVQAPVEEPIAAPVEEMAHEETEELVSGEDEESYTFPQEVQEYAIAEEEASALPAEVEEYPMPVEAPVEESEVLLPEQELTPQEEQFLEEGVEAPPAEEFPEASEGEDEFEDPTKPPKTPD